MHLDFRFWRGEIELNLGKSLSLNLGKLVLLTYCCLDFGNWKRALHSPISN